MKTFFKNINWKVVVYWTLFMSFFNVFLMPYYDGEEFTAKKVLSGIIIWFLSGIIFGKIVHSRNIKQSSKDDN
jgi:hypothetical protein